MLNNYGPRWVDAPLWPGVDPLRPLRPLATASAPLRPWRRREDPLPGTVPGSGERGPVPRRGSMQHVVGGTARGQRRADSGADSRTSPVAEATVSAEVRVPSS